MRSSRSAERPTSTGRAGGSPCAQAVTAESATTADTSGPTSLLIEASSRKEVERPGLGPPRTVVNGSRSRRLDLLEHVVGVEEIERVVQDLHELDGPGLVDDEVGALGVAIDRARLVGLHRAVGGQHLAAEIGEEELLGRLRLQPSGECEGMIGADAQDLESFGLEQC